MFSVRVTGFRACVGWTGRMEKSTHAMLFAAIRSLRYGVSEVEVCVRVASGVIASDL